MCHAAYRLEKILGHLPFSWKFYSTREEELQAAIIVACATAFYYMFLLHVSIARIAVISLISPFQSISFLLLLPLFFYFQIRLFYIETNMKQNF